MGSILLMWWKWLLEMQVLSCLDHSPDLVNKQQRLYCMVCKLEEPMRMRRGLRDKYNQNSRTQNCLCSCSNESCYVQAHSMKMKHDRKIFQMECFHGMSCFDIAHSDAGQSLWQKRDNIGKNSTRTRGSNELEVYLPTYSVKVSHPLYAVLRGEYRLSPHNCKRKRDDDELDDLEDM